MTINKLFVSLLGIVPLALAAWYVGLSPVIVFSLSALAIVPLAKYIGDAIEDLTLHAGAGAGGIIGATFGNATELIIGLFALHAGLFEVVKASITGAIIGNLLLVLGTAMLVGGVKRERQEFNATAAKAACSMLILATIALVIPAVFLATGGADAERSSVILSVLVALLMMLAYGASLVFTLRTHRHLYKRDIEAVDPRWSIPQALIVLGLATVGTAVMSDILVGSITPLVTNYGWTELFIGVIVVAIVGNVAEHLSAVTAAWRDRMDLSFSIAIGSATQIVMFVAPLFVIASVFLGRPMDLVFHTFELIAIIFSVFVANAVLEDGVSTWFEGFQLLIAYVIMAVAFFFHA